MEPFRLTVVGPVQFAEKVPASATLRYVTLIVQQQQQKKESAVLALFCLIPTRFCQEHLYPILFLSLPLGDSPLRAHTKPGIKFETSPKSRVPLLHPHPFHFSRELGRLMCRSRGPSIG